MHVIPRAASANLTFALVWALVLSAGLGLAACSSYGTDTGGNFVGANASGGLVAPDGSRGQLDPGNTMQAQYVSDIGGRPEYKIGASDVLKITVFQVDDLNRSVQVSGNGTITLPLIGQVTASGRTAQQVESDIAARLRARYLQSPQVTVFIDQYNSQKVTVGGAVKKPGVYPVKGSLTLLEAIATAEGMDNVADPSNVVVFRDQAGARYVGRFNVDQMRAGAMRDPLMQNGDVVMVDSSGAKTVLRDWSPALNALSTTATFVSVLK